MEKMRSKSRKKSEGRDERAKAMLQAKQICTSVMR